MYEFIKFTHKITFKENDDLHMNLIGINVLQK
jgi:hypothetical protein